MGVHTINRCVNVVSLLPHKPSKPRKQTEPDTLVRLNTGLLDAALDDALQELAYD